MEFKACVVILCIQCLSFTKVYGDFFSNLEKLDLDTQLLEIDKMMNTIDDDEDEAMDQLGGRSKDEDDDVTDPLGALTDLLGGGECTFKCKNGNKPKPKKGHKPTSNGCGSFGLQVEVLNLPGVTKCCDKHDMCYDTCNSDRKKCDDDFKKCLLDVCKKTKKAKMDPKDCKAGADIMYMGAATFGCQAYTDAQETACTCSTETQPQNTNSRKANSKDNTKDHAVPKVKDNKHRETDDKVKKANKPKDKIQSKTENKMKDKDASQTESDMKKRKPYTDKPKDEL